MSNTWKAEHVICGNFVLGWAGQVLACIDNQIIPIIHHTNKTSQQPPRGFNFKMNYYPIALKSFEPKLEINNNQLCTRYIIRVSSLYCTRYIIRVSSLYCTRYITRVSSLYCTRYIIRVSSLYCTRYIIRVSSLYCTRYIIRESSLYCTRYIIRVSSLYCTRYIIRESFSLY